VLRKQQRSFTKVSVEGMELLESSLTICVRIERIEDEYAKREGGA
jgi:hypothetical protein